jgi:hypothetical protein
MFIRFMIFEDDLTELVLDSVALRFVPLEPLIIRAAGYLKFFTGFLNPPSALCGELFDR